MFRYRIQASCNGETLIWWHDSAMQYETMPIAAEFIEIMKSRHGQGVVLNHVTRQPILGDVPPPQSDAAQRVRVYCQNEVPLLPSSSVPRLGGST
jgi:hypothetical protein